MNPVETPWGVADLEATMAGRPDSYMVPKVRTFADVEKVDSILNGLERQYGYPERSVKLLLLATETPQRPAQHQGPRPASAGRQHVVGR